MNNHLIIKILVITLGCLFLFPSVWGQVDETKSSSDTLFIYEEEVVYDTLYLQSKSLTKEELLEAFQRSGLGELYYNKGHYWLTGNDNVFKLDNNDLLQLFTPAQYESYRKAKREQYISIPFYVLGAGAVATAGYGLVRFCSYFVQSANVNDPSNSQAYVDIWKSAMVGLFFFGGGLILTPCFMIPAIVLSVKGKVTLNNIAEEFNTPSTSLRLNFGPTPAGIGVTLSF